MFLEFFKNKRFTDILAFLFLVAAGIALLFPYHDFQLHLAQGDHGNNLYAFRKTLEGGEPYRDYWWVYGPLMPYYYAAFLKIFGVNMHSVLMGYVWMQFLCGVVFYLILRRFFASYMAVTATAFFWAFNTPFEHTYNHIGGILAILAVLYFLLRYLQEPKKIFLYLGLLWIFILSLIKLNFGLAMLLGFMIWLWIVQRAKKEAPSPEIKRIMQLAAGVLPVLVFFSYWIFLKGLPVYAVRQCLLFLDTDPNRSTLWNSMRIFFDYYLFQMYRQNLLGFGILVFLCSLYFLFLWGRKKIDGPSKRRLGGIFLTIFLFAFLGLHEFAVSGIVYRMFWIEPLRILAIFVIIFSALQHCPKVVRLLACAFIVWAVAGNHMLRYQFLKPYQQYIPLERGKIYITNSYPWLTTVMQVTAFLKENLGENETFLALPSEQLYYFLTDRDSPTRQSEFGLRLTKEQEEEEMFALETKKVRFVLLSNRYRAPETGMGVFGEAYATQLAGYIKMHYRPLVIFGQWQKDPEWFANHGVLILKRIEN